MLDYSRLEREMGFEGRSPPVNASRTRYRLPRNSQLHDSLIKSEVFQEGVPRNLKTDKLSVKEIHLASVYSAKKSGSIAGSSIVE